MSELRKNIESLRERLCRLIETKELTDTQVVFCSQQLDELLVQYEKINLI